MEISPVQSRITAFIKRFDTVIASGSGGFVSAVITCPFEVVKTRMQVTRSSSASLRGVFAGIIRNEGPRGLFCGLTPLLMGLVPTWVIYFATYARLKTHFASRGLEVGTVPNLVLSAIGAGLVSDCCTAPLWLVKTRMMTQVMKGPHFKPYSSVFECYTRTVREEGFFALWRGLGPQMLGVVHAAIQFPFYEWLKNKQRSFYQDDNLTSVQIMICSALAKGVASVVAYPHEVLRSRLQYQHELDANRYRGITGASKTIWREEGIRGFYKGLSANLIRTIPATAVAFSVYEQLMLVFRQM